MIKSQDKNSNIFEFSLYLKGFQFWRIVSDLRVHLLRNDYFAIPMEDKFESLESILLRTSLCSYSVSWKMYLFTSKKSSLWVGLKWLFYSAYFCDRSMERDVFCGINFCNVDILKKNMEKMLNLFLPSQCFNKMFSTKSKKTIQYIWE